MQSVFRLLGKQSRIVIGLMSGTSLDGVDAAVVRVSGQGADASVKLIGFTTIAYEDGLRERIKRLCTVEQSDVASVCGMNVVLAETFAHAAERAASEAGMSLGEVDLISSHGQTIWHMPEPGRWPLVRSTLQIGDISVIAKRTGKPVVGDYRPADMAVGGQGAPLVPYADYWMFRHPEKGRVLQNIGGIGNCTAIPAGGGPESVIAFDTGPGNMLIDQAVYTLSDSRSSYDEGGRWAATGRPHEQTVAAMMADPYFAARPPKTTGREWFGKSYADRWLSAMEADGLSAADQVATFTAFTAHSIVQSCKAYILPHFRVEELIVSGGGAHNRTLLGMIAGLLPELTVTTAEALGVPSDAKEAVAFALFANDFLFGQSNNLPAATGADRPTVMGKLALPD